MSRSATTEAFRFKQYSQRHRTFGIDRIHGFLLHMPTSALLGTISGMSEVKVSPMDS